MSVRGRRIHRAALTVIEEIEQQGLLERNRQMGDYFKSGLECLAQKHALIGIVEGIGLGLGVEFVRDRKTKEPAAAETNYIVRRALEYGVLINLSSYYGNRVTFMPPYVITKADIDTVLEVLDKCLTEVEQGAV